MLISKFPTCLIYSLYNCISAALASPMRMCDPLSIRKRIYCSPAPLAPFPCNWMCQRYVCACVCVCVLRWAGLSEALRTWISFSGSFYTSISPSCSRLKSLLRMSLECCTRAFHALHFQIGSLLKWSVVCCLFRLNTLHSVQVCKWGIWLWSNGIGNYISKLTSELVWSVSECRMQIPFDLI